MLYERILNSVETTNLTIDGQPVEGVIFGQILTILNRSINILSQFNNSSFTGTISKIGWSSSGMTRAGSKKYYLSDTRFSIQDNTELSYYSTTTNLISEFMFMEFSSSNVFVPSEYNILVNLPITHYQERTIKDSLVIEPGQFALLYLPPDANNSLVKIELAYSYNKTPFGFTIPRISNGFPAIIYSDISIEVHNTSDDTITAKIYRDILIFRELQR